MRADCLFDKGLSLSRPEIVPFRLTPNMLDALGLSGYEGTLRRCSEVTMDVLRKWRDTLLSVLEPFIHDPLVEWKKTAPAPPAPAPAPPAAGQKGGAALAEIVSTALGAESENMEGVRTVRRIAERLDGLYNTGAEFLAAQRAAAAAAAAAPAGARAGGGAPAPPRAGAPAAAAAYIPLSALEVKGQVHRLLREATNDAHLLQMYVGWCVREGLGGLLSVFARTPSLSTHANAHNARARRFPMM